MSALLMVWACGGKAVVDPIGDAGGAGGGGGAVVVGLKACQTLCEAKAKCGDETCLEPCLQMGSHLAPCRSEYETWVLCTVPLDPPQCTPVGDCSVELDALYACVYPTGPCEMKRHCMVPGSSSFIECSATCGGVVYTSTCGSPQDHDFPMGCSCHVGEATVGTCQSVTITGFDCCSALFADSG